MRNLEVFHVRVRNHKPHEAGVRAIELRYVGPPVADEHMSSIRLAFRQYLRRHTTLKGLAGDRKQITRSLRKLARGVKHELHDLFLEAHPWVENLRVEVTEG